MRLSWCSISFSLSILGRGDKLKLIEREYRSSLNSLPSSGLAADASELGQATLHALAHLC